MKIGSVYKHFRIIPISNKRLKTAMTKKLISYFTTLFALVIFSSIQAQSSFFDRFGGGEQTELLAAAEAFQLVESRIEGSELVIQWQSAKDYYYYRKTFKVVSLDPTIQIGELQLPTGQIEDDPLFGKVEVYFDPVLMRVPLSFAEPQDQSGSTQQGEYEFRVHAQGCNKPVGVCYPPQQYLVKHQIDSLTPLAVTTTAIDSVGDNEFADEKSSFFWNIVLAFGVGIVLVFTPCVLPMLPILSGLIVGQENTSRSKAVWLSLAYILGTAITYSTMGVAAGAAGIHLQAYFQHPAIIAIMVTVLGFLAASMFGLFELRLPSSLQNLMTAKTDSVSKGGFFMTVVVGLFSALVVSTCVSPLLILVLGAAMREGSPVIGGVMMFVMALGMGIPLLLFAMGAQWLLPRAGAWMERVKEFFGYAVIATAILVASSLKTVPSLLLWSIWLIFFGLWLWRSIAGENKLVINSLKIISIVALLWGGASGLGAFYGGDQLWRPLDRVVNANKPQIQLPFVTVTSASELEGLLISAKEQKQAVLVDYYADWCTYCVVMEKTTYRDPEVEQALKRWILVKVDVTVPNEQTQSAKNAFKVIAPPATLFIDTKGNEMRNLRRFGYIKSNELISMLAEVES